MKAEPIEILNQLESLYAHPGFPMFWNQLQNEIEMAKVKALAIDPSDPQLNQGACYRKGILDGLLRVEYLKGGLLEDARAEMARTVEGKAGKRIT